MTHKKLTIIIGSRRSQLARKQVDIFKSSFSKKFITEKNIEFSSKFLETSGDKFLEGKLSQIGNKGLFTKEIDEAQLNGDIDLSIHSLKDLPYKLPKGLIIGAYLKRADFRDALVSKKGIKLNDLKKNAIIGTSSVRREAQLRQISSDFQFLNIRGNIETRIKKVKEGKYDATLLAMAGLKRLNIKKGFNALNINEFTPAVGQGTIVVIVRAKDKKNREILKKISNTKTELESKCERNFLSAVQGSCQTPLGALAILKKSNGKENIEFRYFVSRDDFSISKSEKYIFSLKDCLRKSIYLGKKLKDFNI